MTAPAGAGARLHDGAQARLISLRLRLGLIQALADTGDGGAVREQLDQLGWDVDAAIRSLRELARGLHPPILEQSGVAAALRAHVRELPILVSVQAEGLDRYPRAVEGAVYFACLEAVQNAVRHGDAARISVELAQNDGLLCFCVRDDGDGFDPDQVRAGTGLSNIHDRISALGGRTRIESTLEQGTRVSGELPARPLPGSVAGGG